MSHSDDSVGHCDKLDSLRAALYCGEGKENVGLVGRRVGCV